ncbi:helix-turn-helix transcriptional regulator [bacterium]|nr:helix-turn-helix transcriptional regulator [bacterium]
MATVGFNIKVERLRRKLSQAKLAEMANVVSDSIQKIEGGKQTPSCLVLYDIAKALDVPLDTFYKDI